MESFEALVAVHFMNYTATAIVELPPEYDIYVDEEMVMQCYETNKQLAREMWR